MGTFPNRVDDSSPDPFDNVGGAGAGFDEAAFVLLLGPLAVLDDAVDAESMPFWLALELLPEATLSWIGSNGEVTDAFGRRTVDAVACKGKAGSA